MPRARWGDSDDGEGACQLPARPTLILEDQVAIKKDALGRQEGNDTRKPRSPTSQGAEPSKQHSNAVIGRKRRASYLPLLPVIRGRVQEQVNKG